MPFNLTVAQLNQLMTIEKRGAGYFVTLRGGQTITGNNFLYISAQIKKRFNLEISALQLIQVLDSKQS